MRIVNAVFVAASSLFVVLAACSSSSSGGGVDAGAVDSGGQSSGNDAGGSGFDAGETPGKCPSELQPGQSCPSPCAEQTIDGKVFCLNPCNNDGDCKDATYNKCYIAINACTPGCTIDNDCTKYGFNICLNAHDCE
jgi:hypothetical protein